MEINNSTSFHYLVIAMSEEFRQVPVIQQFENCIYEYAEMCGCNEEAKNSKRNDCEILYQNIILNNMSDIKSYLLDYHDEFTFSSIYPEEKFLAHINKIN